MSSPSLPQLRPTLGWETAMGNSVVVCLGPHFSAQGFSLSNLLRWREGGVGGSRRGLTWNVRSYLMSGSLRLIDVWADLVPAGVFSQTLWNLLLGPSCPNFSSLRDMHFFMGCKLLALQSDVRTPGCSSWVQPTCVPWENTYPCQTVSRRARNLCWRQQPLLGPPGKQGGQPLSLSIL